MKKLIVVTAVMTAFMAAATPQVWADGKGRRPNNDFKKGTWALTFLVDKNHHKARKYAYSRGCHAPGKIGRVQGRRKICCARKHTRQPKRGYRSWDFYMNDYRY